MKKEREREELAAGNEISVIVRSSPHSSSGGGSIRTAAREKTIRQMDVSKVGADDRVISPIHKEKDMHYAKSEIHPFSKDRLYF